MKKIKILIIAILLFFGVRFLLNSISIIMFNNKSYSSLLLKPLFILNVQEPYIIYYNNGNFEYKNKKYDLAIEDFKKSLNKKPPKSRVCDIRINLSLSTIYNIESNDKYYAIEQLELAKSYLFEDDCAHEFDDNGLSKDAEKLEKEIDKLIQDVKNDKLSPTDEPSDNEDDNSKDDYSEIEDELKKNEKDANSNRQEDLENSENLYAPNSGYYQGKKW